MKTSQERWNDRQALLALPKPVLDSLIRKFEHIEKIPAVHYDSLNGCWYFIHAGMYHGVESDGYIHT